MTDVNQGDVIRCFVNRENGLFKVLKPFNLDDVVKAFSEVNSYVEESLTKGFAAIYQEALIEYLLAQGYLESFVSNQKVINLFVNFNDQRPSETKVNLQALFVPEYESNRISQIPLKVSVDTSHVSEYTTHYTWYVK